jgi:hypothetical protein
MDDKIKKIDHMSRYQRFTYNFAYPALAGSMLYELISKGIDLQYWWGISRLCIVLMFTFDYWHLYFDLLPNAPKTRKLFNTVIDSVIPVAFAYAMFSFSRENAHKTALSLLTVSILQLIYPCFGMTHKYLYWFSKIVFVVITAAFSINYFGVQAAGPSIAIWLIGCSVWSGIHTFGIARLCCPEI